MSFENFIESLKIIGFGQRTKQEAYQKVRRLKKLNQNKPRDNSRLQIFLDWLAQPCPLYARDKEDAAADVILMKGYWEAIRGRDKQDIHQHVHLHGVNGEHIEIQKELDELEERKNELKRKMEGF